MTARLVLVLLIAGCASPPPDLTTAEGIKDAARKRVYSACMSTFDYSTYNTLIAHGWVIQNPMNQCLKHAKRLVP